MKFEIMTDTCANLPEEMVEKNNLHMLSLSFFVDDEEFYSYEEGKKTDLVKFYQMMRDKKDIRTSLVNMEYARERMEPLLKEGKDILYIGFSSGLSGTYQAVKLAMDDLRESYPERKLYAMDTLAAALGQGLLVDFAVRQRQQEKEIEQVYEWLMENRMNICHWITVDDLFFLKRGGRVSSASAVIGSALSIKPIIHVDEEGHLINVEKARGRKKAIDVLLRRFGETAIEPEKYPVFISHGDCLEDAQYMESKLKEQFGVKETLINVLDPVIGAHAGPGTLAVFFYGSKR